MVSGTLVAVVVLIAAAAFGVLRKSRDGKVRAMAASPQMSLTTLGVIPGEATLLQFSSAFCAPCRAARIVCAEAAKTTEGVRHIEVDAESHLDAVRAFGIRRTPTVLIISAQGQIAGRAEGPPKLAQVRAALGVLHA